MFYCFMHRCLVHESLLIPSASSPPPGSLLGPGLSGFQGPGLLVFNDSVFSEQDFESISRIGDSVKRAQAGKTGRFG